jgi:hypothetical protein
MCRADPMASMRVRRLGRASRATRWHSTNTCACSSTWRCRVRRRAPRLRRSA